MEQQVAAERRTDHVPFSTEGYEFEPPRRGTVREATVLSVGEHDMLVDLGCKRDGFVSRNDLDYVDETFRASLQIGDHIPVSILKPVGYHGGVVVSLSKGLQEEDWLRAERLLESEETFEGEVVEVNRGGVLATFGRLRGFVPNSHLASVPRGCPRDQLMQAKEDLVGQTLTLRVLEVNQRRRRLVLSERVASQQRRRKTLEEVEAGDERVGVVRNLTSYGAFVDLGGIDGLIHVSELAWHYVEHPSEVLSVGDKVPVYVLGVDRDRERISLSRKRLLPDPWSTIAESLSIGQIVEGEVTSVAEFGIFVDVGEGVEGLVHTSEIPPDEEVAPEDLKPRARVAVEVLDVDQWRQRIALSLKDIAEDTQGSEEVETSSDVASA